jgi:hypothetical protein
VSVLGVVLCVGNPEVKVARLEVLPPALATAGEDIGDAEAG